ncbi:MAG: helix-turn-helix domain-containing protein [Deltaproteobacteria bacterium]|nr:helix-turn-helix domain-containing protein [Deltaproteobacteria bacterium]
MASVRRLLDVEQAGRALGVSRATVFRRIRSGALSSVKVGGRRRVPIEAIEASVGEAMVLFGTDNPIFGLIGIGRGRGPGWSRDKYPHLG